MTLSEHRDDLAAILGVRRDSLPLVFSGNNPRALKIGIHFDLYVRFPSADRAKINAWLERFTSWHRYLKKVSHSTHRHDLDLVHVEAITEAARARARAKLRHVNLQQEHRPLQAAE